jgi:anti-anti-sigma factor
MLIIPVGEIDLATRDALRASLAACDGHVIVDLSGVSYLDSSGVGVLVAQRNRLVANGGSLRLLDPRPQVWKLLQTVGLGAWLNGSTAANDPQSDFGGGGVLSSEPGG